MRNEDLTRYGWEEGLFIIEQPEISGRVQTKHGQKTELAIRGERRRAKEVRKGGGGRKWTKSDPGDKRPRECIAKMA